MSSKLVSVVMPVRNGERYLKKAVDSVISQTYNNFELIVVDDGSTDSTLDILESYSDPRLRILKQNHKGVSCARNKAIRAAVGEYIAMHDADDISFSDRFEKQVSYLEKHSGIGLVGSTLEVIDENDHHMYYIGLLTSPDDLKFAEIFSNQIGQGSVMARNKLLHESGLYNPRLKYSEDTDLWRRLSHLGGIANIKEPLYRYRVHQDGASQNAAEIFKYAFKTTQREFDYYIKNKSEYIFFSFHPFSMHGGLLMYLERKGDVYSRLALMYSYKGLRRKSIWPLFIAILHAPWMTKLYRQLLLTIASRDAIINYKYEIF